MQIAFCKKSMALRGAIFFLEILLAICVSFFLTFAEIQANSLDFLTGKSTNAPVENAQDLQKDSLENPKDLQNKENLQNQEKQDNQKNQEKQENQQELEKRQAQESLSAIRVLPKNQEIGFFSSLWLKIKAKYYTLQLQIYKYVAELLTQIKAGDSNKPIWSLVLISFLYGIFHAAGPGHGKAVIATYITTQNARLKSGVILAFFMAQAQAISAIFLVYVVLSLVDRVSKTLNKSIENMYFASAVILIILALWLIFSSLKNFRNYFKAKLAKRHSLFADSHNSEQEHKHSHECEHGHGHSHEHEKEHSHQCQHSHSIEQEKGNGACAHEDKHEHEHSHQHLHDEQNCSCAHSIDLEDEKWKKSNFWQQFLIVASVGLRPCTGAIMILAFSKALNIWLTGIIATFVMAFGVGITMVSLAIISVYFRDFASKMLKSNTSVLQLATSILKILGGLLILLFAALLFTDTSATSISTMLTGV